MSLSLTDDRKIIHEYLGFSTDSYCVGTDEAGRGPLAGPLVVAAVLFDEKTIIPGVFDSKTLTEKKRNDLSEVIKEKSLAYHIEEVSLDRIENLNIYQSSKWGMITCFKEITNKINCSILLTDAMKISPLELPDTYVISLVKGDQKSFHIAAASILAKCERDRIMKELHEKFPMYQWDKNKGYPTKNHRKAIQEFGISIYHRRSFKLL